MPPMGRARKPAANTAKLDEVRDPLVFEGEEEGGEVDSQGPVECKVVELDESANNSSASRSSCHWRDLLLARLLVLCRFRSCINAIFSPLRVGISGSSPCGSRQATAPIGRRQMQLTLASILPISI
jgi:hypothetical protein